MRISKKYKIYVCWGLTAFEVQVWKYYIRIVHLTGGGWNSWKVWKRFSLNKESE